MSVTPAPRRRGGRLARALGLLGALALLGAALSAFASRQPPRVVLRHAFRAYSRWLHYYPLTTRAITTAFIMLLADLIGQVLSRVRRLDPWRLMRYCGWGLVGLGPTLHLWYLGMNTFGPEDDLDGSVFKALFEQVTLEPLIILQYILYDGVVMRKSFADTMERVRTELPALWMKNAIFWIPANFSNYYIGTPELRVLFANLCSLFWNTYFTLKVNGIVPSVNTLAPGSPMPVPNNSGAVGSTTSTASSGATLRKSAADSPTGSLAASMVQATKARLSGDTHPAFARGGSGSGDRFPSLRVSHEPPSRLLPVVSPEALLADGERDALLSTSTSAPGTFRIGSGHDRDEIKSITPAVVIV